MEEWECDVRSFYHIESCPIISHLNNFHAPSQQRVTLFSSHSFICWEKNNFPSHNLWGWGSEEDSSKYFRRRLKSLIFSFLHSAFLLGAPVLAQILLMLLFFLWRRNKTLPSSCRVEYLLNLKPSLNFHLKYVTRFVIQFWGQSLIHRLCVYIPFHLI